MGIKKPHEPALPLVGFRGGWRRGQGGETREIVLAEKNQGEATNTIMRRKRRRRGEPNDSGYAHTGTIGESRKGGSNKVTGREVCSQVAGGQKRDRHT